MVIKTKVVGGPRFRWNDVEHGRAITKYINTMCKKYPKIAKMVLRHGIGDLNSWFSDNKGRSVDDSIKNKKVTCGCMVGTTALVAMKAEPTVCELVLKGDVDETDAADLLFRFILVKTGKFDGINHNVFDQMGIHQELYSCISEAGYAASDETNVSWGERGYPELYETTLKERELIEKRRHKDVIDHIEFQFKKKLGMVRMPSRTRSATK